MPFGISLSPIAILVGVVVLLLLFVLFKSIKHIPRGSNGWLTKNFGKKLADGGFLALNGEAGIQPDPIQNGWRFVLWPLFSLHVEPLVQIPANTVGLVIAQVGAPLNGTKTAVYNAAFGDFQDVRKFVKNGGQQGVQRPVLRPGETRAVNPYAFLVVTAGHVYGIPVNDDAQQMIERVKQLNLNYVEIPADGVGVVTTLDGPPLEGGAIAGRIGNFDDIKLLEQAHADTADVIAAIMDTKNKLHSNYEDFQSFIDQGGSLGMQHDVLVRGLYALNPLLVKVDVKPILVVQQGEVMVIKAFVGLPTVDSSGPEYKFGSIVSPGHRGIWAEPLRTGKYPINPYLYDSIKVPTAILQLNWATATSAAHDLDKNLKAITAKSKDAFQFSIDLQVQIHVPDTKAARVIGSVGTMENLVNEVLQAAVGNYFRNKVAEMPATNFIESRGPVQEDATTYITDYLARYDVEVRGVYIQDVVLPQELIKVLTEREIAKQEKTTFAFQQEAQQARIALEAQSGRADMQKQLATAQVTVDINKANAEAAVAQADGNRQVLELTGKGEASKIEAVGVAQGAAEKALGLGKAAGYEAQRQAIGAGQTAVVAVVEALSQSTTPFMPQTLIAGGGNGGGITELVQLLLAQATQSPASADTSASVS